MRRLLNRDYGDAPTPYPTLLDFGTDAARHVAIGPQLGAARDTEIDGLPTPDATGDGPDDDGVTFATLQTGDTTATVTVHVTNAPTGARLDAWIDFNADGNWGGADERVAFATPVVEGDNLITFAVPQGARPGQTFARFRLSTAGGLGIAGDAADGEVEDYAVTILAPRSSVGVFGEPQLVNDLSALRGTSVLATDFDDDADIDVLLSRGNPDEPLWVTWQENTGGEHFVAHQLFTSETGLYSLAYADIDGDGDKDVFGALPSSDKLMWYEQTAMLTFVEHLIVDDFETPLHAELVDLDSDGDLDVVSAAAVGRELAWFENNGQGAFSKHTIAANLQGNFQNTTVSDVDSDGNLDVAIWASFPDGTGSILAWFEHDGSGTFTRREAVAGGFGAIRTAAADIDSDGDTDLLSVDFNLRELRWHENDGSENFSTSTISPIDADVEHVQPVDFDQDGDVDVVGFYPQRDTLHWFENDGSENFTAHLIDDTVDGILDADVIDVDLNGTLDIVTVSNWNSTASWYSHDGNGSFTENIIAQAAFGGIHVSTADLDHDGDADVIASYGNAGSVVWHENLGGAFRTHLIDTETPTLFEVEAVDFDADGDLDLIASSPSLDSYYWLENDGQQQFVRHLITDDADRQRKLNIVDFEGDGDFDIVSGDSLAGQLHLFRNDGTLPFTKTIIPTNGEFNLYTESADLDGDGDIDVLGSDGSGTGLGWHENLGGLSFLSHEISATPNFIRDVLLADFDGDKDLDAVVTSSFSGRIYLYENDGVANFTQRVVSDQARDVWKLEVADLDGDGDLDLFAVDYTTGFPAQNRVMRYENLGNLEFEGHVVDDSTADEVRDIWAADIDTDGDLDLITVDSGNQTVAWYENLPAVDIGVDAESLIEEVPESATFSLTRGGDAGEELTVEFAVAGEANFGNDYQLAGADTFDGSSGTATFAAGVDVVELVFTAIDDDEVEPNETLQLDITPPAGYVIDGSATASITIESLDFLGDYGDAPQPYGTLLANDGARHLAVGPTLGATLDEELDGTPTNNADGDGADEDGVTFGTLRAGDNAATITINVANASEGAVLDAWIDFNGDGSWDGGQERITSGLPVVEGANVLTVAVPAGAVSGTTYSRFRLTLGGIPTPHGQAADGEVEDYAVTITPPNASGGVFLDRQFIDANVNGPESMDSADFDGDGDLDLVAAVGNIDEIVWFENISDGVWSTHVIATDFNRVHAVTATDLDGDGDQDVVAAPTFDNSGKIAWYENNGNGTFIEHLMPFAGVEVDEFVAGDFDGDGDMDLAAADAGGLRVELYRNDGSENFTVESIVGEFDGVSGLDAVDLDRDGDLDLIAASHTGSFNSTTNQNLVAWLENDGAGVFTLHTIDDANIDTRDAAAADFDGDGDFDIVATFDDAIRWYENDGNLVAPTFTAHDIHLGEAFYRRIRTADLDGDGDQDVVAAVGSLDAAWFENDGLGAFTRRALPFAGGSMGDLLPGDIDGDGDLDLAFGTAFDDTVAWYEAVTSVSVAAALNPPGTSPVHISEASGSAIEFTFTRQGDLTNPLTVHFAVSGAAWFEHDYTVAGADTFSFNAGTITFLTGESTATLTASPIYDALTELDEPVVITLLHGTDYLPGDIRHAMAVITSDEFGGDLGDAPSPYPTLLADNGAGHQPIGPRLGATRTVENDGNPAPSADADTDDGVTFGAMSIGQLDAIVTVDIQNAPLGARLDAWIDFNGDGHWGGPGEQILHSVLVTPGINKLQVAVPVDASSGTRISRFRLSTVGNLGPTGVAADGEVEDYLVTIDPPAGGDAVFIDRGGLVPQGENLELIVPVDFDRDGDLDIIAPTRDGFTWFENTGTEPFTAHLVQGSINNFPQDLVAADFNGDGLLDVGLLSQFDDRLLWFEQNATGDFTEHEVAVIDDVSEIIAVDYDLDGDQDLISLQRFNGDVSLHENQLDGRFETTELASFAAITEELSVADVDGDGDLDLAAVVAGGVGGVVWLESQPGGFTQQLLPVGSFDDFRLLVIVDLDGDNDLDFVAGDVRQAEADLIWWEQVGLAQFELRQVSGAPGFVRALRAADVDADGDVDLLTFGRATSGFSEAVVLHENDGQQVFTARDLAFPSRARNFELADADQDGDLDIVTAHIRSASNIQWHENITNNAGDFDNDGTVSGSDFLAWQRGFGQLYDQRDLSAWQATFGQSIDPPLTAVIADHSTDDVDPHQSPQEQVEANREDNASAVPIQTNNGMQMFSPLFLSHQDLSKTENDQADGLLIQRLFTADETPREQVFAQYAPRRRDSYEDFEDIASSRDSLPKRRAVTDFHLEFDEDL